MSSLPPEPRPARARFNAWNLLLLLPLLMLVTPWFNRTTPRLAGIPFFYWYQFAFVLVGVASVWIVYATSRRTPTNTQGPDRLSVDDLDEGSR
ncbi:MAG TPA: DUF3311 domain-containing protein [Pseudonocardiaceae bacterium]|jgi:hypothetical protein|nr:DUF3311 domain-containing protein [Pseudonocardiaceae bacterium]